jgi:hypothetical protein
MTADYCLTIPCGRPSHQRTEDEIQFDIALDVFDRGGPALRDVWIRLGEGARR